MFGARYRSAKDTSEGYAGNFTGYYNAKTEPEFSVGEYWPTGTTQKHWYLAPADIASEIVPGTTDVTYKTFIKTLIQKRKEFGITDMSEVKVVNATDDNLLRNRF